jgi:hypothetical protein
MSQAILVWGAPSHVPESADLDTAFVQSGRNFGNILIGNGVRTLLEGNELVTREDVPTPAHADERCSQVVIPAANFLWKDFDFGYMFDYLEKTHLPITIVGVGAQTNDRTVSSAIHPNTLKLMKLVAERSASLGVRGFYTAEVLAANGIHNVQVIGCPSLYTNRTPTVHIDKERLRTLEHVSVNFSRRVNGHAFHPDRMKQIENTVLAFALDRSSTFIAQDEIEELTAARLDQPCAPRVLSYFDKCLPERVDRFFREKSRYFCDVQTWASYIRTQSLSMGSRFHGNLIALINGTPALMVIHDSRTMEMCTLLGIPNVHVSKLTADSYRVEWLMEQIEAADFTGFERAYSTLYQRFVRFLTSNGLKHSLMAETA